jgi:hypothetical protein
MVQVNKEMNYPHYLHAVDHTLVTALEITGDVSISFAGLVDQGGTL